MIAVISNVYKIFIRPKLLFSIREPESENSSTLIGEPPLIQDEDQKDNKKRIKTR